VKNGGVKVADIDIDSMLEKQEKKERREKAKKTALTAAVSAAVIAVLASAGIILFFIIIGEPASDYFPPTAGRKLVYNVKGKSPQQWQVEQKSADIYGYDCAVVDKMDKGTFLTSREYYAVDKKKGIARLAYSENSAAPVKDVFVILPYRLKTGRVFNAANYMGTLVKGTVVSKESLSTPAGEFETYRVEYKSARMDKTVWYAKGVGEVMEKDNMSAAETGLISAGE
jgi:hypothetical protein